MAGTLADVRGERLAREKKHKQERPKKIKKRKKKDNQQIHAVQM
jgi:hypothetical protein